MVQRPTHTERHGSIRWEASRSTPMEDAELVERVRAGDTRAFHDLVIKYQDRVFNACWRVCGHLEDARDLTQDAFLKAFESLDTFRYESGFFTWLFRIAVNLSLSHRRSSARRRVQSLDGVESTDGQAMGLLRLIQSDVEDETNRSGNKAEQHAVALRALGALDDDHRAVVVLRDMEGLDYQQIAEILEVPPGTVKSRLHRARLAIEKALGDDAT